MRDEDEATAIAVGGGQGVVVGSGNTQINNWQQSPSLTPATLAALSAHAAAARLRVASHDDAVDLFASAPTDMLSKKLRALLLTDEAMVIAILADLDRDKVTELVGPYKKDLPWLAGLPVAAEAIAERAAELQWDHDPEAGRLERAATSPQKSNGYFRQYRQGRIYCRYRNMSHISEVYGPMGEFHLASGGTGGELGFPLRFAGDRAVPTGAVGTWQAFEGAYVATSVHGTYRVPLGMGAYGTNVGQPLARAEERNGVKVQRFEAGVIYSSKADTIVVRREVAEFVGDAWIPTAKEEETYAYLVQRFKDSSGAEMAVYSSSDTGAVPVTGRTLAFYEELGGPAAWLGCPVAVATAIDGFNGRFIQRFERGSVYERLGHDVVAVPAETVDLVGDKLGWPASPEKLVDGDDGQRIQYFRGGLVTRRDDRREVWLPADPSWPGRNG